MEDLKTIYKRAMQYCVAMWGYEADELHLLNNGCFRVVYWKTGYGEHYEETHEFDENCLTEDLDSVYEKRKKLESEEKERREAEYKKRQEERIEFERKQRKEQYLKLKKEFEQD